MRPQSSTVLRSRLLALTATMVVAAAVIAIVLTLDTASNNTVNNFVRTDERRTLEYAAFSVLTHLRDSIPFLQFGWQQSTTGWGSCADMDTVTLRTYFEEQIRLLRVGVVQYMYVSSKFRTGEWWDCNCASTKTGYVCQRPIYQNHTNTYVLEQYTFNIPLRFPLELNVSAIRTEDYRNEEYVQDIMGMTEDMMGGVWLTASYYYDASISEAYALLSLSMPLSFDSNHSCTKAISVDVNLRKLSEVLERSKAYASSLLFIYSISTGAIVSTSNPSWPLWDEEGDHAHELYLASRHPQSIIRDVVAKYHSRHGEAEIASAGEGVYDYFDVDGGTYQVASSHLWDRNLHYMLFEITPRSVYFANIENSRTTSIAIGSTVGAVALLGVLGLLYSNSHLHRIALLQSTRDVTHAPNPLGAPEVPVGILFTDIQGSSNLWGAEPNAMHQAVTLHHDAIRTILQEHKAYEVKTIGDSFMVVTKDAMTALVISNEIQHKLMAVSWPGEILQQPDAEVVIHEGVEIFRGLRVRIGIHYGVPVVSWDEVAKGYDYYGESINIAARLEAQARGGETILSTAVYEQLPPEYMSERCVVTELGSRKLKGITNPIACYSVVPIGDLSGRTAFHEDDGCVSSPLASPSFRFRVTEKDSGHAVEI